MFDIRAWFADKITKLFRKILPHLRRAAEIAAVNTEVLQRKGSAIAAWEPDDLSRHLGTAAEAAARLQLVAGVAGADKLAAAIAAIKAADIALRAADDTFDKGWAKANVKLERLRDWLNDFVQAAKDMELLGFKHKNPANRQPVLTAGEA